MRYGTQPGKSPVFFAYEPVTFYSKYYGEYHWAFCATTITPARARGMYLLADSNGKEDGQLSCPSVIWPTWSSFESSVDLAGRFEDVNVLHYITQTMTNQVTLLNFNMLSKSMHISPLMPLLCSLRNSLHQLASRKYHKSNICRTTAS